MVEGAASRRLAAVAGHTRDQRAARAALLDPAPATRAAALGALARMGSLRAEDLVGALADTAPSVRRRACDLAGRNGLAEVAGALELALKDAEAAVVEAACYALGELGPALSVRTAECAAALAATAVTHDELLCREAAVAALGSLGHPGGLPAVLAALQDKPAVRRRAVVALAAFDGPAVDEALASVAEGRDWQARQIAEDLLSAR